MADVRSPLRVRESGCPEFKEQNFEFVDNLESVLSAGDEVVMIELWAAFGGSSSIRHRMEALSDSPHMCE